MTRGLRDSRMSINWSGRASASARFGRSAALNTGAILKWKKGTAITLAYSVLPSFC